MVSFRQMIKRFHLIQQMSSKYLLYAGAIFSHLQKK